MNLLAIIAVDIASWYNHDPRGVEAALRAGWCPPEWRDERAAGDFHRSLDFHRSFGG